MKQVLRKGLREIVVEEVADPSVTRNHVLVRPAYSLISAGTETAAIHTDPVIKEVAENPGQLATLWNVLWKTDPASTYNEVRAKFQELAVLGYSGAGTIVEVGDGVEDLVVGQRVAYGGEGTGHGETLLIGRNLAARIPDRVDLREASFTTLGAIAMNAVRLADIRLGDTVAVIGLGIVGQLVAQLVRCSGGVPIVVDIDASRVQTAIELSGAEGVVASSSSVDEVVAKTGGLGADRVIVAAAAKTPSPLLDGIRIARDRGRIILVGACPVDLPRDEMYAKELSLRVSRAYGPGSYDPEYEAKGRDYPLPYVRWTEHRNMEEFLRLLGSGSVRVASLISHEFDLAEAPQAYNTILEKESASLAIVLKYPSARDTDPVASFSPSRKVHVGPGFAQKDGISVALVGAGNLAKWAHLPAIGGITGVSLRAVCSNSGARGKSYANRFKADYATSDYDELLADAEIDAVIVATRHSEHASQVEKALLAGKHVLVEKPMAISYEECSRINTAAAESGRQVMVGFNRRFAPFYCRMKNALLDKAAPLVMSMRVSSPGIEKGWAADAEQGGVILGEGCHFMDLMYWFANSEPVSVFANGLGEHSITGVVHFLNGSIGSFVYSVAGSPVSGGERVEIFGPGVMLETEDFKSLSVKGRKITKSAKLFAAKGYKEQLSSFVESIQQGRPTVVNEADGTRATLMCLALLESRKTGKPVFLDELRGNEIPS